MTVFVLARIHLLLFSPDHNASRQDRYEWLVSSEGNKCRQAENVQEANAEMLSLN